MKLKTDLVIMGSGMAGISAADAALARGKKVMVFEKKPYQGGAVSNCPIAYLSIRNDKDFQNLMDVYLDSVFSPNIYKEQNIFRQEGWHYELNSPEDELTLNGVVYNEMKGAFSSADGVLDREIYAPYSRILHTAMSPVEIRR